MDLFNSGTKKDFQLPTINGGSLRKNCYSAFGHILLILDGGAFGPPTVRANKQEVASQVGPFGSLQHPPARGVNKQRQDNTSTITEWCPPNLCDTYRVIPTHLMSSSLAKIMTPRAFEVSISLLMIFSNSPGRGSLGIFMDCAIHRPPVWQQKTVSTNGFRQLFFKLFHSSSHHLFSERLKMNLSEGFNTPFIVWDVTHTVT